MADKHGLYYYFLHIFDFLALFSKIKKYKIKIETKVDYIVIL